MKHKITITFEIEAEENELDKISSNIEAAIENYTDLQSLVTFGVEEIYD